MHYISSVIAQVKSCFPLLAVVGQALPESSISANLFFMSPNERSPDELDFGRGDPSGYAKWQQERADWLDRIRREIGLPINRRVRVRLRDIDGEFCGLLTLVELPLDLRRARHQLLRVGDFEFTAAEIESCVRED
jgi:hypothetical protein